MRSCSEDFKNLSLTGVLTLAQLWKITRADGEVFGFTDHDRDIEYNGTTYEAAKGYLPSAISQAGNLAVDNLDVATMISAGYFTEEDIIAGVWDNAQVDIYLIDYEHTDRGVMILALGWKTGEFKISDQEFSAEIRSKTQQLQQIIVEITSPECRATLGDERCKIIIHPPRWEPWKYLTVGTVRRATTHDDRRYICLEEGVTGATEPEWDTTPGEITEDAFISWLCHDFGEVGPWQAEELVTAGVIRRATTYDYRQYVCINPGTTGTEEPEWDPTPGEETNDGTAAWLCIAAWYKGGTVTGVTDRREFEVISLADENNAFAYGVLTWFSGANAGYEMEVKAWTLSTHKMVLFEKMPFTIEVGDAFGVNIGCDQRKETCRVRFANVINMRAEPDLPGIDETIKYTT